MGVSQNDVKNKDPEEFGMGNKCKGMGKLRRSDHDSLAFLALPDEILGCWSCDESVCHDHDHDD